MTYLLLQGDARHIPLADESVDCVVTSPPYWGLRSYGIGADNGELGAEATPDEYVAHMVEVFREVKRVLKPTGTCWLNLGSSYASAASHQSPSRPADREPAYGSGDTEPSDCQETDPACMFRDVKFKPKDMVPIPWMVAMALQQDGWYLRCDVIWSKPNPMPESVTDRPTKAHEYVFLLTKSARYWWDAEAVREESARPDLVGKTTRRIGAVEQTGTMRQDIGRTGIAYCNPAGRNCRSVWSIATSPYKGAHYATMAPKLAERCILAGCPVGGIVFDPFVGSGTTVAVAVKLGRRGIGLDLSAKYLEENAEPRVAAVAPMLAL